MKTISFAVPCYNSAAYMDTCIESILKCGDDIEILIVDDGSTKDDTAAKADAWQERHPGLIRAIHKENGGHGSAVNMGLANATGRYFKVVDSDDWLDEHAMAEIMELAGEGGPLPLRRALAASSMLSSDVSAGFDPAYASAFEAKNSAFLGRGLVFNKYTGSRGKSGSNDANAEYVARIRRVMDDAGVSFQTAELGKVDVGGGGTIAYIPAKYGMDVIDSGVAVLSMHSPWEVTSKADIYEAFKGYEAFLKNA